MRHLIKLKKLNRTSSHRKAMLVNMTVSLFKHEHIKTTIAKAKALKPIAERLITKARNNDLATRRYLFSKLQDKEIVEKLLIDLGVRNAKRPGGYIRILKAGFRTGDNAPMAIIELVEKKSLIKKEADKKNTVKNKKEVAPTKDTTEKVSSNTSGTKVKRKEA